MKKRLSDFDKTLREFEITRYGIRVSRPLKDIDEILSTETITLDREKD